MAVSGYTMFLLFVLLDFFFKAVVFVLRSISFFLSAKKTPAHYVSSLTSSGHSLLRPASICPADVFRLQTSFLHLTSPESPVDVKNANTDSILKHL